jgi:hypothetical protein
MGLPEAFFPEYNMVYRMMRNAREKYDLYQAIPESSLKEIKTSGNGHRHLVTIQRNNHEDLTFEVSFCAILIGSRPNLSFLSNVGGKVPTSTMQVINHHVNNNSNSNNTSSIDNNENVTDNFIIRSLRRLKIFCEKCRHLNLCFGLRNRSTFNNLIEDAKLKEACECEEFLISEQSPRKQIDDSGGIGFGEDPKKPIDCKNNPISVNKYTNEFVDVPGAFALGPLVGDNFVRFIAGGALSISSYLMRNK